jgi:hypothetical protein
MRARAQQYGGTKPMWAHHTGWCGVLLRCNHSCCVATCRGWRRYLILNIKRFTKNNFFTEKNPTIVNFPVWPTPTPRRGR